MRNEKKSFAPLSAEPPAEISETETTIDHLFDMCDVKGQFSAKRGLEIAAAGGLIWRCRDAGHRQKYVGESLYQYFTRLKF